MSEDLNGTAAEALKLLLEKQKKLHPMEHRTQMRTGEDISRP